MSHSVVREIVDSTKPMLLVHGGAWDIPDDEHASHHDGMMEALTIGSKLILENRDAMSIVSRVVSVLENHEAFDAGYGSVLNRQGFVEMDAGIMDGATGRYGSVIAVKRIKNPIKAAYKLSNFDHGQTRILISTDAESFAEKEGLELVEPSYFHHPREQERFEELRSSDGYHTSHSFADDIPRGTVGCVVIDKFGHVAAATSTGGAPYTLPGRVGDSPIPGSGFYANEVGGISCTGWGEAIAGSVLASKLSCLSLEQLKNGGGVKELERMSHRYSSDRAKANGGYILLRKNYAEISFSTPKMARSYWSKDLGFATKVNR